VEIDPRCRLRLTRVLAALKLIIVYNSGLGGSMCVFEEKLEVDCPTGSKRRLPR
jgi:hypothetical protein